MQAIPSKGDRFQVSVLEGYVWPTARPAACQRGWSPDPRPERRGEYSSGCICGRCNGRVEVHDGTVVGVTYWADNSIDVEVRCDDGVLRRQPLAPPSGDLCF